MSAIVIVSPFAAPRAKTNIKLPVVDANEEVAQVDPAAVTLPFTLFTKTIATYPPYDTNEEKRLKVIIK